MDWFSKWQDVEWTLTNKQKDAAEVVVEIRGAKPGETYGSEEIRIPGEKTEMLKFKARKNGELQMKFRFPSPKTWIVVEPKKVPAKRPPGKKAIRLSEELDPIPQWNQTDSKSALEKMAEDIGATPGFPKMNPESARKALLGYLQIVQVGTAGNYDKKLWEYPLAPELSEFPQSSVFINRSEHFVNRDLMLNVSASIPLYSDVATKITSSDMYSIKSEIQHYSIEYTGDFTFDTGMRGLEQDVKEHILARLKNTALSRLIYIEGLNAVQQAVFEYKKGKVVASSINANVMTIAKGDFTYDFKESESEYASIPPTVVGIKYMDLGDYSQVLADPYFKQSTRGVAVAMGDFAPTEAEERISYSSYKLPSSAARVVMAPILGAVDRG